MRLTAMLVAAVFAYIIGIWALVLPDGLWVIVWLAILVALVSLGRWLD